MNNFLYAWIEQQFYLSNVKKYHKYFNTWIKNITPDQIDGFNQQRIGMRDKSKVYREINLTPVPLEEINRYQKCKFE